MRKDYHNRAGCAMRWLAEGVGIEPTDGFLDRHSLANCCLTIRRNPPCVWRLNLQTSLCAHQGLNLGPSA